MMGASSGANKGFDRHSCLIIKTMNQARGFGAIFEKLNWMLRMNGVV